jgi:hypothetical protein
VQYAHVQAGKSYAQAVRSNDGQQQNVLEEGTISQIMGKLDQQESLKRIIPERVTKLALQRRCLCTARQRCLPHVAEVCALHGNVALSFSSYF